MKKFILLILLGGLFILFSTLFLFSQNIVFIASGNPLIHSNDFTFLLLGKPGPGYIGSENTDSIIAVYYRPDKNKLFLIPIPRDLIVYNEKNELEKINALYGKRKIKLLLEKASAYTGLKINHYFAIDLELVKKLVDELGGLEIVLDKPIVDAVTLYTLPAGKYKLNGYFIELVLRSRYNPEGDFFRIENQMKVLKAFKEKIANSTNQEKIELLRFLEKYKYHWETNLDKKELLKMSLMIRDFSNLEIIPLIITPHSGLLTSGYFNIYNSQYVYGIFPRSGIDNYKAINIYLRAQMQE